MEKRWKERLREQKKKKASVGGLLQSCVKLPVEVGIDKGGRSGMGKELKRENDLSHNITIKRIYSNAHHNVCEHAVSNRHHTLHYNNFYLCIIINSYHSSHS